MRRNALSMSPVIWLLFGATLAAAATLPAAHAAADDAATCEEASGDVAVAACTRAIASGQYEGHDLARLHYYRAMEHGQKGDSASAIADYNRGIAYKARGDLDRALWDYYKANALERAR
jgi:tetratricopeptide (TPR) repeat protein